MSEVSESKKMSITIELPADIENALRQQAVKAGKTLTTLVCEILTTNLAAQGKTRHRPRRRRSPEEFARRLDLWIKLHPVLDHAIDDSRESIYEGRGE